MIASTVTFDKLDVIKLNYNEHTQATCNTMKYHATPSKSTMH